MKPKGLTLVEAIIAAVALILVLGIFTTLVAGNLRTTSIVGARAQANQLAAFLGRQIVEGDTSVLPQANQTFSWGYGNLTATFNTLTAERQFGDINLYSANITNKGTPSWAAANWSVNQYSIQVCWKSPEGEKCAKQDTVGPTPASAAANPGAGDVIN